VIETNDAVADALHHGGVMDITTIGRKTGLPRRIELVFHNVDGRIVISGRPGFPRGWVANLRANPDFTFHLKRGVQADLPAHGRVVTDQAEREALQAKQGRAVFGVDLRIVDENGRELPWDGKAFGDLQVRGPWVIKSYFKGEGGDPLEDGWFPTGDVCTIDPEGYIQITDRSKDVIKSGGEWISSIDLENIAIAHPAIAEAAVIGVRHSKWDERPIVVAVKKPGQDVTRDELLRFYEGKIAKWWMPDDVVFVNELPHTATGKLSKLTLRQQFKDYRLDQN